MHLPCREADAVHVAVPDSGIWLHPDSALLEVSSHTHAGGTFCQTASNRLQRSDSPKRKWKGTQGRYVYWTKRLAGRSMRKRSIAMLLRMRSRGGSDRKGNDEISTAATAPRCDSHSTSCAAPARTSIIGNRSRRQWASSPSISTARIGTPGWHLHNAAVIAPVPAPSSINSCAPTAARAIASARRLDDGRIAPTVLCRLKAKITKAVVLLIGTPTPRRAR